MTKLQTLVASLEKAEAKVEKINGTIERHFKRLEKNKSALEKSGVTFNYENVALKGTYSEFANSMKELETLRSEIYRNEKYDKEFEYMYNVCSALEDIRGSYKKLADAEKVVSNWNVKVIVEKAKTDFASSAPQVIIDFVNKWGELAFNWMMENTRHPDAESIRKTVENEKQIKIIQLTMRVTDVTGTITDASHLSIGEKGDLVGYIKGEKGTAEVQTISAGGWNIQRFHYRTIVTKL